MLKNSFAKKGGGKEHCMKSNIPFKNLLIANHTPDHRPYFGDLYSTIEVVFLLPNTTLTQPLDQGVRQFMRPTMFMRSHWAFAAAEGLWGNTDIVPERLQHLPYVDWVMSPRIIQVAPRKKIYQRLISDFKEVKGIWLRWSAFLGRWYYTCNSFPFGGYSLLCLQETM